MDVRYSDDDGFLWARLNAASWTIDEVLGTVTQTLAESLARKRDCVLYDFTGLTPRPITMSDRYRMGSVLVGLEHGIRRVAGLLPPEMVDPDKFGERVAQNRGLNLRVFTDMQEARRWLLDG